MGDGLGVARLGECAIVCGGSVAGLLAARALGPHFARVVVVDRDELPATPAWRKGAAQSHHGHALLAAGEAVFEEFFPGLFEELAARGATTLDVSATSNWFYLGSWKRRFESGMRVRIQSRELLEHGIRERVRRLPNVVFQVGAVQGIDLGQGPPRLCIDGREQHADLVVDASGRGSHFPDWLASGGLERPRVDRVGIRVSYASARYAAAARDWDAIVIYPEPPAGRRGGFVFPMEDGSVLVNLIGWCEQAPPTDDAGFRAFAASLPQPEIHELLQQAERRSVCRSYRHAGSAWQRYDLLGRSPGAFVALGDALCCFDPVYAQGMSAAGLEAQLLGQCAGRAASVSALADAFRRAVPRVLEAPWKLAETEDRRFPQVGNGAFAERALHWYTAHVQWLTGTDDAVYRRFMRVVNLLDPPSSLLHPSVVGKVAVSALRGPERVSERPRA